MLRIAAVIVLLLFCSQVTFSQTISIHALTDDALELTSPITIGRASDVAVDLECRSTQTSITPRWSFADGTSISTPLATIGISQDEGILRIYPATQLDNQTIINCTEGTDTVTITLMLVDDLFFINPPPVSLPSNVSLNCTLPDLPVSMVTDVVTVMDNVTLRSCEVSTDRGSFIHGSIPVILNESPQFIIYPVNTSAPTNGTAAFTCTISPDVELINITWFFDDFDALDVAMAIEVGVVQNFSQSGVSILIIGNVSVDNEGSYRCVAFFTNGINISSNDAFLNVDDNVMTTSFSIRPPSTIEVQEGANVSIPCVSSNQSMPVWSPVDQSNVISNEFTLEIIVAMRENQMNYTCDINGEIAQVEVIVLFPLRFNRSLMPETIVTRGDNVNLTCMAEGNPPPSIIWLSNTSIISSGSSFTLTNVQPSDSGIYQCLAQLAVHPFNSITSLTYLNIQFTEQAVTDPPTQLINPLELSVVTVTCTISSHPLASIVWDGLIDGVTITQSPTRGFRGPTISTLTINSTDAIGTLSFNCTDGVTSSLAIVNGYSPVTIVATSPNVSVPVLVNSIVTFNCTASSIPKPTIQWFRNGTIPITQGNITIINDSLYQITSILELNVTDDSFSEYSCFADNNEFFNATESAGTLLRGIMVNITTPPSAGTLVEGENVTYNCSADGFPLPSFDWFINDENASNFTIRVDMHGGFSTLAGLAPANQSNITCRASNIFNSVIGDFIQLVAGPPLAPTIGQDPTLEPRLAVISWMEPFSHLVIIRYNITITRSMTNEIEFSQFTIDTTITIPGLLPFNNYTVNVTATNRAGTSPPDTELFTTSQDAPEGAPTIIMTSSIRQGEINLEWTPIDDTLRNGIITHYIIQYTTGNGAVYNDSVTGDLTSATLTGLEGGTLYHLNVSGTTIAGRGPSSDIATQTTINNPPTIVDVAPPLAPPSDTTIPVSFPSEINAENTEFVWVVVIKLNTSDITSLFSSDNPDVVFPNNNSFLSLSQVESGDILYGRPYVASEISQSVISSTYTFIIGSSDNDNDNDQPSLYANPPLEQGTYYTYFIRAFPPPVQSETSKRQLQSNRQYSVFSSTKFASPQATNSISGGATAAIVIVIILLFLILVVLIVIAVLLVSLRRRAKYIPPPARQGSVRLTESQRLLEIPQNFKSSNDTSQVSKVMSLKRAPELAELTPTDQREPIPIAHFPEYVRSLHANTDHLFSEEYELLTFKSPSLPHQHSLLPYNQIKNRYANINSFDNTRVTLTEIPSVEGSDYINANYIDGYGSRDTYIACQGPLPETTHDFWRMVWEQKSSCIIMLTNCVEKGRPKCHQYWPQSGSMTVGELTITIIDQQTLSYYTIRTFKMNMEKESREIKQFHYTAWPDFGVPDHPNPMISFIRRVNHMKHEGPDIVHCSAGVGRSGTYIAIQSMMAMIEAEGKVDVFNFVLDMRHKRNYMVQTEVQYMFVHDSLVELIRVGYTDLTVSEFPKVLKELNHTETDSDVSPIEQQFDKLNSLDIPIPSQFISATLPVNKTKNRFQYVLPYEAYRVRLLMLPGVHGSDYINASYVDGYLRCNQFILTQGPMNNTVDDFWRMVWETRVSAIVMLCQLHENGKEQSVRYWPTDKLTQYGDIFIETLTENDTGFYIIRELQMTHTKQGNDVRVIKQFHFNDWSEDRVPETSAALIDMIGLVQKAHHLFGGGPVVVHDSSSVGRAGTFCVLNIVIERLKVEGLIDVFFTVHSLRRKHPGIITTFDQYKFCYQTVLDYLNSFDKYANFD